MNGSLTRLVGALRHPVASNAMALWLAQVAATLIPLLTLPILARELGASQLGLVIFVQSFSFLLTVVLEYGFTMSVVRDVARLREDREALGGLVAAVHGAKALLCAPVLLAWGLALALVPALREAPGLAGLALLLALLQGLHPSWYFAGLEQLRQLAAVDLSARLLSVLLIVLLVDDPGDVALVLWIYVATIAAPSAYLLVVMYRQVPLRLPSLRASRDALRSSSTLFVTNASTTLYTTGNLFVLGLLVPSAQVAFFGAADKAVGAVSGVLGGAAHAAYPRVNVLLGHGREDRANRLARLTLVVFGVAAALSALGLLLFAPLIVDLLFGPEFVDAVALLRVLALILPLRICAAQLSVLWLLPRDRDRDVLRVTIVAGLVNLALLLAGVPLLGVQAAAWSLVAVELLALVWTAVLVRRLRAQEAPPPGESPAPSPPASTPVGAVH